MKKPAGRVLEVAAMLVASTVAGPRGPRAGATESPSPWSASLLALNSGETQKTSAGEPSSQPA